RGGGAIVVGGAPSLRGCRFIDNLSWHGGAIYGADSGISITGTAVTGAHGRNSDLELMNCDSRLQWCRFHDSTSVNAAKLAGGSSLIEDCEVSGNGYG